MTKEIEEKVKAFIGKAEYDLDGNQIVGIDSNGGRQLLLDVRGWGAIQNLFISRGGSVDIDRAKDFQDQVALFIVDAINNSLLTPSADVQERANGMQWVKASERLPEKMGRYFVKVDRVFSPDQNDDKRQVCMFTGTEWYLENHHHSRDFFYCKPYEWLDESSPSSMQAELQQLRDWKESAMKVMNDIDLQECGKVIGVPLGQDVSGKILPAFKRMQAENERFREALEKIQAGSLTGELTRPNMNKTAREALNKQQ